MIVEELAAKLGLEVDTGEFLKGFAALEGLHAGFEALKEIATAAGKAILELVPHVAESAIEAEKAAQRTGMSAEAYQELAFAAEQTNISADTLQHSMILLARQSFEAAHGSHEAAFAFRQLGVGVYGAHGQLKPTDELLGDLADRFSKMPDGVKKTALATQAFGRGGAELIPLLNKGRAGIDELRDSAESYGVVLDEDVIAAAERWEKQQKHLQAALTGLRNAIGGALLRQMGDLVEKIAEWVRVNRQVIAQGVIDFLSKMRQLGEALFVVIDELFIKTDAWQYALLGVAAAFAFMNAPLLALVGALLVFEDIFGFIEGKDSLIGSLFPKDEVEYVRAFFKYISDTLKYLFTGGVGEDLASLLQGEAPTAFARAFGLKKGGGAQALIDQGILEGPAALPASIPGLSLVGPGGKPAVQQTNHTTINVHATSADPKQIADHVARRIDDHHQAKMREGFSAVDQ